MNRKATFLLLTSIVLSGAVSRTSSADDLEDFALDVKDYTGNFTDQYITQYLTHFKVGSACWKKLHDKNNSGLHSASFWVRDVNNYAKKATGDDWSTIEVQNNNDREKNKVIVEKMVKEFAPKFSFTLQVEGNDCDAAQSSLALRYWGTIGEDLQYLSGKKKVNIVLDVTSKLKDIEVKVSGNTITVRGSRDIEPAEWDTKIKKGIERSKL